MRRTPPYLRQPRLLEGLHRVRGAAPYSWLLHHALHRGAPHGHARRWAIAIPLVWQLNRRYRRREPVRPRWLGSQELVFLGPHAAGMLLAFALVPMGTWAPRMVEEDTQPPPWKGRDAAPWPSVLQEVLSHAKELSAALAKMDSKRPKRPATHEELLSMERAEPERSHKRPLPKGLQDMLSQAKRISEVLETELQAHLPSNDTQTVETEPSESSPAQAVDRAAGHNDTSTLLAWHNDTTTLLARVKELSAVLADAHSEQLNAPTEEGVKHMDNDALLGRAHELSAVLAKASWHSLANHSSANHPSANHSTIGVVSPDSDDPTAVMEAESTETGTLLKRAKQLTEVLGGPIHHRHPKVRLPPLASRQLATGD